MTAERIQDLPLSERVEMATQKVEEMFLGEEDISPEEMTKMAEAYAIDLQDVHGIVRSYLTFVPGEPFGGPPAFIKDMN
jgi:hypothetical protein